MSPPVRWARWELSRRVELTLGLRLIVLDRAIKFVALVTGGIALLVATRSGALAQLAAHVQAQLELNAGRGLWLRLVNYLLQHYSQLSGFTQWAIAVAAIAYGALEGIEGVGILLRRRWAEYLVLLATVAFIPVEVDELVRHPSPLKAIAFAVNVAIAVYLVWRKRLFLDRPPATSTQDLTPAPP